MPIRGGTIINIAGTTPVDDPEYRYKMPAVFGKIEGSGNGIKTVIPNITDVATSLHRSPGEVNKFFGCELGAQTTYNEDTDRAVVNGAHTDDALQKLVHKYCEGFVICPNCGLPETKYSIKSGVIWHRCAACGAKEMVDMGHKLTNYILAQDKKNKKDKNKKKNRDAKKGKDDSDEDKEKKKKDKKEKKAKKEKKSKKDKKESSENGGEENDDYLKAIFKTKKEDDFGSNSDEDEVASEAGVDDDGAMVLAVEGTRNYLHGNPDASVDDIIDVVTNQQMASALKAHDRIKIFVRAAITPQFFKNKEIEKYAPVVAKLANGNKIIERHLIATLEFLSMEKPKNFPVMIKQFYDEDALEEETIIEWAEDGRSEYTLDAVDEETRAALRGEAEPVVVWLQEADSDSDSDDE
mmetsp:Transcript_14120/g.35468  ORF Transcript_14120/g.35468 Transcript_14120/m.35468 type:complete len:408 (-) Transcript_14120:157-1380(-)|eukprot:CAMPEP_0116100888 /NCGR_PEP_ID=MMETSP0327-20121206/12520_1 /TAXON_ID=44447 /ORGANISM="Pseudo-nitzschia delicatissima, Strain B596" /LENGTH=407 /DNA_ID=CAMNT_0003592819 /DNA_START=313 /DNA_END=1536 /DNA_ORIENTATION=+